jgi:hypothetical protein
MVWASQGMLASMSSAATAPMALREGESFMMGFMMFGLSLLLSFFDYVMPKLRFGFGFLDMLNKSLILHTLQNRRSYYSG